jgi:hypothetical protein
MAKVRVEEIVSRAVSGAYASSLGIAAVEAIGAGNAEVTPTGTSARIFGPAAKEMDVYVRNWGGQIYVTKGAGTPVVTALNGTVVEAGEYLPVHLLAGESIAVMTASVA